MPDDFFREAKVAAVDTSIAGVFHDEHVAREQEAIERRHGREQGLIVEDDDSPDGEWQVSWKVEEYAVDLSLESLLSPPARIVRTQSRSGERVQVVLAPAHCSVALCSGWRRSAMICRNSA